VLSLVAAVLSLQKAPIVQYQEQEYQHLPPKVEAELPAEMEVVAQAHTIVSLPEALEMLDHQDKDMMAVAPAPLGHNMVLAVAAELQK
tara:strand:- start:206 stop:469 length:264 start_codon:yes stop_codon:yes gene_type:complete